MLMTMDRRGRRLCTSFLTLVSVASCRWHLTVVFAALAIARELQAQTGVSLKKLVQTLRPLRSIVISIGEHTITADPTITTDARAILDRLPPITLGH